jgi:hypothetical protein
MLKDTDKTYRIAVHTALVILAAMLGSSVVGAALQAPVVGVA